MEQYYINVQNSGPVAQWIEQLPSKQWVVGSIPPRTAKKIISQTKIGWLYFFGTPEERGIGLPEQSSGSRHKVPRQFPARTAGADYRFSVGCIFLAARWNGELGWGCCKTDSSFSLQGANAAPCTPAPRSAGGGVLSCGMRCVVVVRLMWCNSSPSAAFSGDRGIRLAPRLAPAGEENPPQPPRTCAFQARCITDGLIAYLAATL